MVLVEIEKIEPRRPIADHKSSEGARYRRGEREHRRL